MDSSGTEGNEKRHRMSKDCCQEICGADDSSALTSLERFPTGHGALHLNDIDGPAPTSLIKPNQVELPQVALPQQRG